jgi:hypothetical protein
VIHITSGDCAADLLRASGLPGNVIGWRDSAAAAEDGLSRAERECLEAVAAGASSFGGIFRAVTRLEEPNHGCWYGDGQLSETLGELSAAPHPALTRTGDGFALTDCGRALLAAEADWVEDHGIDRWQGAFDCKGRTSGDGSGWGDGYNDGAAMPSKYACESALPMTETLLSSHRKTLLGRLKLAIYRLICGAEHSVPTGREIRQFVLNAYKENYDFAEILEKLLSLSVEVPVSWEDKKTDDAKELVQNLGTHPLEEWTFVELTGCPSSLPAAVGVLIGREELDSSSHIYRLTFIDELSFPRSFVGRVGVIDPTWRNILCCLGGR